MSAIFIRPGDEDGFEMPVKELVSKSMLCMVFGFDEKAFIYILNDKELIECTMLGLDATFYPTKPGKYLVKTGDENESTKSRTETELEDNWLGATQLMKDIAERREREEEVKRLQTSFFQCQSEDMILKVVKKINYGDFLKLAQCSERMVKFTNEHKAVIDAPLKIRIELENQFPRLKVFVDSSQSSRYRVLECTKILKSFRFQCVSIDATESSFNPEMLENEYRFVVENGMKARILRARGITPSQTRALAKKLNAKEVVFIGDAIGYGQTQLFRRERKKIANFVPEEFPNLKLLKIADTTIYEKFLKTNLFMRTVRKAETVRLITFKNADTAYQKVHPLLKEYLESNDRGLNKSVKLEIGDFSNAIDDLIVDLLEGYNHKITKHYSRIECHFCNGVVWIEKNGHISQFTVHLEKSSGRLYVTFEWNNDEINEELKEKGIKNLVS